MKILGIIGKKGSNFNDRVVTSLNVPLIRQKMTISDGFATEREALEFGNNSCGAACLKMVLEAFGIKNSMGVKRIQELAIEKKCYLEPVGWLHKGLAQMAREYGLGARTIKFKRPEKMLAELKDGKLIIASVSCGFDQKKKGGHLIVIRGVTFEGGKLAKVLFNDPSGFGQDHQEIDGKSFLNSWTGRAIIIGRRV